MSKRIYAALTSLDGFIEDHDGRFDWAVPDAEVPDAEVHYADLDISISGLGLARHAFRAGLVDEA